MRMLHQTLDFSYVQTIIYHLPNGQTLSLKTDGIEDYLDFELEFGHICDTSQIDGVIHFFPKGNA